MSKDNQIDFDPEKTDGDYLYIEGLPRQCPFCQCWSRHKKPPKTKDCFSVKCPSCHKEFEVVKNARGFRK